MQQGDGLIPSDTSSIVYLNKYLIPTPEPERSHSGCAVGTHRALTNLHEKTRKVQN